ncbi:MAG: DNA alkylation repair protein [Candidatus Xenobiia bacterium LiM19]
MAVKGRSKGIAGQNKGGAVSAESCETEPGGVLCRVREELESNVDLPTRDGAHRFFKEGVKVYGVKTAVVHVLAKKYFKEIKHLGKEEVFTLCEDLYRSDYLEEASIASVWSHELRKAYEKSDFKRFEGWIERYINNWAKCDVFCNHTVGSFIEQFPEFTEKLRLWTKSDNRWMRRAAAVSLILPARRGEFLDVVFEIADLLLEDEDDLVQKGYGWMLKEASRMHQKEVFDYVVRNSSVMPRTALRYAIEKMPDSMRKEAMKK